MGRDVHILQAIQDGAWAILPEKLAAIVDLIEAHANAPALHEGNFAARPARGVMQSGAVAVLPLFGSIFQRANMLTEFSGGTSTQAFAGQLRQALGDESIGSILIDVDSPGGNVFGVPELADEIFRARGRKPIVAIANSLAASAAYWLASQADEFVVTPSGEVGSIGVLAIHRDFSEQEKQLGLKTTIVSAGKFKTEGNPSEPLGDEARAAIQARVEDYYGMFAKAVARGRGVSAGTVRKGFGEGRLVGAQQAVSEGMADRVATFEETVSRLSRSGRAGGKSASLEMAERRKRRIVSGAA